MASLDRPLAWQVALLTLLFSWPLLLFGHPSHVVDSASYLKGGAVAVEFVFNKMGGTDTSVGSQPDGPRSGDTAKPAPFADDKPKAARSIVYSVAAYVLRWPGTDMTGLAVLQTLCAALIVATGARVAGISSVRRFAVLGAIMAFATPLGTLCATICPDIFAGFAIAGMMLFALGGRRMSLGVKFGIATLIALSVTTHASIPPIALGMIGLSAIYWFLVVRRSRRPNSADWAWLVAPTLAGMAITVVGGFVAFGEVSVAAKRFPLALSRSVVDGPARWYLERECVVPRYAVCEVFGTRIPSGTNEFLFDASGLKGRATPEQMDRIRAEESEIILKAAMTYPGTELERIASKTARQMFRFAPENTQFRERVIADTDGVPQTVTVFDTTPKSIKALEAATIAGLVASVLWLLKNATRLRRDESAALLLLLGGLAGNAFVCVVFSALSDRYQERVIWLVPLLVFVIASRAAARSRRRKSVWLGRQDSNLRMAASKAAALPLGDAPV